MKLTRRLRPRANLKIDSYKIIARAVEEGINHGCQRAHKYSGNPNQELLKREIESAVMNHLSEIIIWNDIYEKD
jgi:hypothetical protein